MVLAYYNILFIMSILLTSAYACIWRKYFDVHFTLIFSLFPVSDLGYLLLAHSKNMESAVTALKIVYLGGCFQSLLIILIVFSLCKIKLKRGYKMLLFVLSMTVFFGVMTIGENDAFYKSITFSTVRGAAHLEKEYGFMHTVFTGYILLYSVLSVTAMGYSYFKKKNVSRKIIYLLILTQLVTLSSYFLTKLFRLTAELTPFSYLLAEILYLVIIHRICLYSVDDTIMDSLIRQGGTSIISLDMNMNYIGCSRGTEALFPELAEHSVDRPFIVRGFFSGQIQKWLEEFIRDNSNDSFLFRNGENIYNVNIAYILSGGHKHGYQIMLIDDTKDQQYINLLDRYNNDLHNEVAEKTAHIIRMHDNLILSMAAMVESRDNSTGGHIKRTSVGVRLILDEMLKDNLPELTDEFCKDMIKAAPMHDLGKIAVDDAILRKPGRFTDDEFEKMKAHAAEGARIVHEILKDTDDKSFSVVAENVAHFHHERWDGSGYPEGLKGEEIPLEARIMAIADVYDALVSKRVYKEKISFGKADAIIMDGMGKHFDKRLEKYYVSARPALEKYYSSLE
ncbi:MAG: HD domain-containing protein [Ruminococcus sp.]|nr:HD domain-containing protein [Ruminococcus sp.]